MSNAEEPRSRSNGAPDVSPLFLERTSDPEPDPAPARSDVEREESPEVKERDNSLEERLPPTPGVDRER